MSFMSIMSTVSISTPQHRVCLCVPRPVAAVVPGYCEADQQRAVGGDDVVAVHHAAVGGAHLALYVVQMAVELSMGLRNISQCPEKA